MRIFAIVSLLLISVESFGTQQAPDILYYKGDTLALYSNPLESYFQNHKRPDSLFDKLGQHSTAHWRGYTAYWKIRNDSLFLTKIWGENVSIDLSLIFKDAVRNHEVFAYWVTNELTNFYGKELYNANIAYNVVYEFERVFEVRGGILKNTCIYDNRKTRVSKYFQNLDLLVEWVRKNVNSSILPDSVHRATVFVQISGVSPEGKIDRVKVLRGFSEKVDQEAIRVAKSIPEWVVLYRRGKPYPLLWAFPVRFERL